MQTTALGNNKARVPEQRAARRFGVALRLTIDGDDGATHDLSATGLFFESKRSYELGASIELVLEFPVADQVHPFVCKAKVVRVRPAGDSFNVAVHLLTPLFREPA